MKDREKIFPLSPEIKEQIKQNPLLNIDTFIIPSPYVKDPQIKKDENRSFVWIERGEILGYMQVYSDLEEKNFHIYKIVTSPFGRGRGIGTAFIEKLTTLIPQKAKVYLYIWEKQIDTLEFFQKKGFSSAESIVYKNLVYIHLYAKPDDIIFTESKKDRPINIREEIGKTRHDARKTIQLLSNMVDMLSVDNGDKIIEDINREGTSLSNMLNSFKDSMQIVHKVNLQRVILERIIPFIEASTTPCELHLELKSRSPIVYGSYLNIGRALINIVSNALESIKETGRRGLIKIAISRNQGGVQLLIQDNGEGIPKEKLKKNKEGIPLFVGVSTKPNGKGIGTKQIYQTFRPEQISIESEEGVGSTWLIHLERANLNTDRWFIQMDRRFNEFKDLLIQTSFSTKKTRQEVIAAIWQIRKMEIFLFDLISKFSLYHNLRDIYRIVLAFLEGPCPPQLFIKEIGGYTCEYPIMTTWLKEITFAIKERKVLLSQSVNLDHYRGALFKSYGQAFENIIIFTFDPESLNFYATDRKLAEHLDFAFYLKKDKNKLLRGQFVGDINNSKPIFLGLWSINSEKDLNEKLKLLKKGAKGLIRMGIHPDKALAFYQTTYINYKRDINSDLKLSLEELANTEDEKLINFTKESDTEFSQFIVASE